MLILKKCNVSQMKARLGGLFCDEQQVLGFILAERTVRFDPSTFTKTNFDEFIQQDRVIGTVKIDAAEDANVDPSFTDLASGESIKNNDGLKKWNIKFYKGSCFQNELQKLDRSERYSVLFVYKDGSILGQQMKDGTVKGFDVKLFTGIKNIKTAAEGGGSTLRMDLTTTAMAYWQGSSAVYESTEIDFLELSPVAALYIKVPILTASSTSTKVLLSNMCADSPVIGLDTPANWKMRRNGVLESITAVTEVNGEYTFTHSALTANDKIQFETNTSGYPVYVLDTSYYVGTSIEKTVA